MPEWSTACPDWEERIRTGQSLVPFPPLFPDEAEAAWAMFRELRAVDVAGSPTMGEISRQWVVDFVQAVFGAYDAESGRRLIKEFLLLVSKKNGKSTLAAGIMLTALLRNWRQSAEFLILAPTVEVANNSYIPVRDMIRSDPELSDLCQVQDHLRTITHRQTRATLKVVAADSETVGGKKATGVLIDELWQFGPKPNAGNMLIEAIGGLASRPEGFVIYLTTHADRPPVGVWKQKLQSFRAIRDGEVVDPARLGVLYEFPRDMLLNGDYKNPENFPLTNPNWGASVNQEFIDFQWREAERNGPGEVAAFAAKHLNVEIGIGMRTDRWPGVDYWQLRADHSLTLDGILQRSDVCIVGIDGGGLDDLLGLSVLGRCSVSKHWLLWAHAWAHKSVLERRKSIVSQLRDFESDGDLTIVGDELGDIDGVIEVIRRVQDAGLLSSVAVDPAGLGMLVDALAGIDVTVENKILVGVGQGYRLMNAIKTAERRLANGTLWHTGSSMMSWCVGNLKIEPTATAIRATKQNAGDAKIDPAMAMFNAVDLMSMNPEAIGGPSIYDILGAEALPNV